MEQEIAAIQNLSQTVTTFGVTYGFQMVGAIIIIVVGLFVGKWVGRLVERLCAARNFDVTLSRFFANVAKVLVLVFVAIIALGKFGITIAPFIAAIGAIAFGASLAIQGPLSNYGAGIAIILGRPFVVGNTITLLDVSGVVEEVRLGATLLSTEDGEIITIPNKQILGEILHNSFANKVVESKIDRYQLHGRPRPGNRGHPGHAGYRVRGHQGTVPTGGNRKFCRLCDRDRISLLGAHPTVLSNPLRGKSRGVQWIDDGRD